VPYIIRSPVTLGFAHGGQSMLDLPAASCADDSLYSTHVSCQVWQLLQKKVERWPIVLSCRVVPHLGQGAPALP
jgi:hypothetical protein